jgi:hypothetical protein
VIRTVYALLAASLAMLASACSNSGLVIREASGRDIQLEPSRFIVVTISNEPTPLGLRAGSSSIRYASPTYAVAGPASVTVHAIERDYGLSEYSAWPIETLRVLCVVFRVPLDQSSSAVLVRLTQDARVTSAQSLNQFKIAP